MKNFYVPISTKQLTRFISTFILLVIVLGGYTAYASNGVTLYTPYMEISVPPGESIDYKVEVINNSSVVKTMKISLSGIPDDWDYDLKSGGWNIKKLSVLPGEKKDISLKVDVPLKVEKGNYSFRLVAAGYDALPLTVNVSEKGTFKTEFTTDQSNMQGHADSPFNFSAKLKNSTAEPQLYALQANTERGWDVVFKANHKQATSVNVDPNVEENISIEVTPPARVEAGTYSIPVRAITSSTSADLNLEVVITGSYEVELTTPRGLLSTDITAGDEKRVELLVRNTGTAELKDLEFDFTAPTDWDVVFEPSKIERLEAGKNKSVFATIKADNQSIAGDYVVKMEASTPEASSNASFRVSVKTPFVYGWAGVMTIFLALGGVFYLFRKYGRR